MRWWTEVILNDQPVPRPGDFLRWIASGREVTARVRLVDKQQPNRVWVNLEGSTPTDFISLSPSI